MRFVVPVVAVTAGLALLALSGGIGWDWPGIVLGILGWIVQGTLLLARAAPAIAILGLAGLIVAIAAAVRRPEPLRGKWLWLLLPFGMPLLILAYGAVFSMHGPPVPVPPWRIRVLWAMVWSHIPIALVLAWVVRRNPLVPLGLSAFQGLLSMGAFGMSYMAITNTWL